MVTKKSIIRKTIEVGSSTMWSRLLGTVREVLMANYLGTGPLAEAFITAFKIPNSLRKIFAEGAMSIAFIPTLVKMVKKGNKDEINSLMTLALILFEGALLLLCFLFMWKAAFVIRVIAPGWFSPIHALSNLVFTGNEFIDGILFKIYSLFVSAQPIEQVGYAVIFLRLLMGFILLLSTSALLAGALQAVHHFFVPAFSQVLLNIFFILGLIICISFGLSPYYLCLFIMAGGFVQLIIHLFTYVKLGFGFAAINQKTWQEFKEVWKKFLPCLFSMSVMEIHLVIDTSLASFLPAGSIALIYYANRFMQIPLGVFANAFSTILLPHFARIGVYAPKRLSFYLFESAKLIFWIMVPFSLLMAFVSEKIFFTLFLSKNFTIESVRQAAIILNAFLYGLFFFSLNKILLNIYYALHNTKIPMYVSIVGTIINVVASYFLMKPLGAYGIALATTLSGVFQTLLFVALLHIKLQFTFYIRQFVEFVIRYAIQLGIFALIFYWLYKIISIGINFLPLPFSTFFLMKIGFWMWLAPLVLIIFFCMLKTRKIFGIRLYFLD